MLRIDRNGVGNLYNKLFTKILDSSIWLAPDPHRLVWITLIAAMDRDGFAQFACIENLAARARVSAEETAKAVEAFLSPDPYDPEQDFEGRRIEKVPGGWLILNAEKYRSMVTQAVASEQAKLRMRAYRDRQAAAKTPLRDVTQPLRRVTPSEAEAEAEAEADADADKKKDSKKLDSSRAARSSATRLPADWVLTEERVEYAKSQSVDPTATFENFRDYWTAASGAKARKHDWDATWRMWCRNQAERGTSRKPPEHKTKFDRAMEILDRG